MAEAKEQVIYVSQGQAHASAEAVTVFSTVLGSCVATCLHDTSANLGGMNHLLLPTDLDRRSGEARQSINLMELLINHMLQLGGRKKNFVAKIFGGANIALGGSTIGARNIAFVRDFLDREGIPCLAESLGGNRARRLRFWPATGRVSQLMLDPMDIRNELAHLPVAPPPADPGPEPEIWG